MITFRNEGLLGNMEEFITEHKDTFEQKVKDVSREIEKLKLKDKNLNYIECTVMVCEKYDIEFESIKKVLSKNITEKIELEAMELNLLTYKNNTLF